MPLIYRLIRTPKLPFQYLTAWARLTLPSYKALDSRLATALWHWCEYEVKRYTHVDEDVKTKEDIKIEKDTKHRLEEVIEIEEVTKVAEITKADEATKTNEDMEAKEDTNSKEL